MTPLAFLEAAVLMLSVELNCKTPGGTMNVSVDGRRVAFLNVSVEVTPWIDDRAPYLAYLTDLAAAVKTVSSEACAWRYVQSCRTTSDGISWRKCHAETRDGRKIAHFNHGADRWETCGDPSANRLPFELCEFACDRYAAIVAKAPVAEMSVSVAWGVFSCVVEGRNIARGRVTWTSDAPSTPFTFTRDAHGRERFAGTLYAAPGVSLYACALDVDGAVWREARRYYGPSYGVAAFSLGALAAAWAALLLVCLDRLAERRRGYVKLQ